MPPQPPVANGASLTVLYDQGGQQAVSVLGGYWTEGIGVTVAEGQRWLNAWANAVLPGTINTLKITGAIFRDLRVSPSPAVEIGPPPAVAGQLAQDAAMAAAAAVVKWKTASAGRTGRGRTFLPGVPQAKVVNAGREIESAFRTALQTRLQTAYLDVLSSAAGDIVPAIVSRKDLFARQITSSSVAVVAGTQRRRMR